MEIERFLCIVDDIEENLQGMYDIDVVISKIEDRLTENEELLGVEIIPIAVLFAGDFLCLDYREKKDEPIVCIWSHDESEELEPVVYEVSNSFDEFLVKLN